MFDSFKKILLGSFALGLTLFAPAAFADHPEGDHEATLEAVAAPVATASSETEYMLFFHGRECPHCHAEIRWLPQLKAAFPDLQIVVKEVWHDDANRAELDRILGQLGKEFSGVPTNIIGNQVIVGFNPAGITAALANEYGYDIPTELNEPEATGSTDAQNDFFTPANIALLFAVTLLLAAGIVVIVRKTR